MDTIVLSLGGSIIVPEDIDIEFLKKFKELILSYDKRFVIVCGGGKTCRKYQDVVRESASHDDLDWIGIKATWLNAELMRVFFDDLAYEKIVTDPTLDFDTDKKIIIAGGWKPGWTTDNDSVFLAEKFNADTLINLSNIEYVYDKDPNKHEDAVKKEKLSWDELKEIVGDKFVPGGNYPFDPEATKKAAGLGLKVIIAKGTDLDNLKNMLDGAEFKGTIIE